MTHPTSGQRNDPPPQLCGWFRDRNAALFVARALLATAARRDWKPRTQIPRRKIRRVLHRAERYLTSNNVDYLKQAQHAWDKVPTTDRRRSFVSAVGDLLYALNRPYDDSMPEWTHLQDALSQVQLSDELLKRIEIRVRLRDFTNGRENKIKDENVGLACAAACRIGQYEFARGIAQRAVEVE